MKKVFFLYLTLLYVLYKLRSTLVTFDHVVEPEFDVKTLTFGGRSRSKETILFPSSIAHDNKERKSVELVAVVYILGLAGGVRDTVLILACLNGNHFHMEARKSFGF